MHVLLVGSGGREHAIAWKLAQSEKVSTVSVAPGNVGISLEPKAQLVDIAANDIDALLHYALEQKVELTVVGPEVPLVDGIVDRFTEANLRILGPSAKAAQLEGSKSFAKAFMKRNQIPTASYEIFSDATQALDYLKTQTAPIVIKADGLAAGKGVVVAQTIEEANEAVSAMLADNAFGDAGSRVVIESFLSGEEASYIALVDGEHCLAFASSQDHKARDEGDQGPNTGGMGAYSPAPVLTQAVEQHVIKDIVEPTIKAMTNEGAPFKGFLYVGLMINEHNQASVVEFNVRLGDPETQPLMMRLETDLIDLFNATIDGTLNNTQCNWLEGSAIGVVLAAGEYPASSSKGEAISGIDDAERIGCKVFHAGTAMHDDQLVTNGGRVLCVCARDTTIVAAKQKADKGCELVRWKNRHYRRDIAYRAVARINEA